MKSFLKLIGAACLGLAALLVYIKLRNGTDDEIHAIYQDPSKPTRSLKSTMGDLSLATWIRSKYLHLQITGEVKEPGAISVSPKTTLSDLIDRVGGPTALGDIQHTQLTRDGITNIYDLSRAESANLPLMTDDSINIPPLSAMSN
ncbi:SLBB domain-containing protein [Luteolibacter pohnpeiensis]|uniref:SLBB domain-containing protein n=1 Tax=Luteolibacter pohnpeiensis TaxID=454153 RepID=A0A934VW03_9BACT|nr:SLBB domain-containing protein [Luteolibacter pohnpeiensis]MBK1882770.1 SLBB domain-containing protein [Luteolibacter pohnpeiensis]